MTTLVKRLFTGHRDVTEKEDEKWTLGKEICREADVERLQQEELEWNGCSDVHVSFCV